MPKSTAETDASPTGPASEPIPSSGSIPIATPDSDRYGDTNSSISSPIESRNSNFPFPYMGQGSTPGTTGLRQEFLNVLIAEDNSINAGLLTKRLKKLGHEVEISVDGQECHDYFASKPHGVDVILMALQVRLVLHPKHVIENADSQQMPLVDGAVSTRMIRHYEQELEELRKVRPRVPIVAVSASLVENNRFQYVESGYVLPKPFHPSSPLCHESISPSDIVPICTDKRVASMAGS